MIRELDRPAPPALVAGVLVDFSGTVRLLGKTWKEPKSESLLGWTFFSIGGLINLFAIETWNFDHAFEPSYNLFEYAALLIVGVTALAKKA